MLLSPAAGRDDRVALLLHRLPDAGEDLFLNQQKRVCLAVSAGRRALEKRGAVLRRDPDRDYENVATAGPVVQQEADGSYRMWYSAIGTRWGYYSICYAESEDGLRWRRGRATGTTCSSPPPARGGSARWWSTPRWSPTRTPGTGCASSTAATATGDGIGSAVASALRAVPEPGVVARGARGARPGDAAPERPETARWTAGCGFRLASLSTANPSPCPGKGSAGTARTPSGTSAHGGRTGRVGAAIPGHPLGTRGTGWACA